MELTATCQQCQSSLHIDDLQETDWVVCSQCNSMFALATAAHDEDSRTSRMAIVSLVLGLVSLVGLFITGIPAIILGLRSLVQIRQEPIRLKGRGLAITGVLTGTMFGLILGGCVSVIAVASFPSFRARTQADACNVQLGDIGLALHFYENDHGSLPPAASRDENGKPLLSWRVLILPHFNDRPDLKKLYDQFHLDEPWDSDHNRTLVAAMPDIYRCPADPGSNDAFTHYAAITGPGTVFDNRSGKTRKSEDPDLLSTILIGEVTSAEKITWTEPRDISISEFAEDSDWLDGKHLGPFDSHHHITFEQQKRVLFLSVNTVNDSPFISPRTQFIKDTEKGNHFHFRRQLFVGGRSLKHLALSEVEVFSGGRGISPNGTATQSSTLDGAVAGRANDGKTDSGPQAFSRTKLEPYPWWELAFKEAVPVERIVLHKLVDWDPDVRWSLAVTLLDADRKVLWHETVDGTIPINQNFTKEWKLSGPDSAKRSRPIVARFLRLEFAEPETGDPQVGRGNKPITGLPILVEQEDASFHITKVLADLESDTQAMTLKGAEILAIKEFNGKQFLELQGIDLESVRQMLQGPAGSTIVLRIRRDGSEQPTEVPLKAVPLNPTTETPESTP